MAIEGTWAELNVKYEGFSRIDFERKKVRKTMQAIGRDIQKEARKLVGRRYRSGMGQNPGRRTGRLRRSIRYSVSRPGFLVRIRPQKTGDMKEFYPAFLFHGVTGQARRKDHQAQSKSGRWRIAPRANYMVDALDNRRSHVYGLLRKTLENSLIPRR